MSRPFDDGPADFKACAPSAAFSTDGWAQKARRYAELSRSELGGMLPHELTPDRALLHAAVALMPNPCRILDVGGAAGADFGFLTASQGVNLDVRYHVVDFENVTSVGRSVFASDPRITFSSSLPEAQAFDLVYASSSLQYFEDYAAVLGRFASYGPKAILLCRHPIAEKEFQRRQVNLENPVAQWVMGFSRIVGSLQERGYDLRARCWASDAYDVGNFSPEQRVSGTANLLFVRR